MVQKPLSLFWISSGRQSPMSSFVCVFCSRCQPNSVNTFPILITDRMQPHCILCLLHGLRDRGGLPSSWLPPLRRAMVENSPGRVSSSKWPCIPHAFTRLTLSNRNTHSPKYTLSLDQTTQNAHTCSRGCGWHSNKDPSLSKETKPPHSFLMAWSVPRGAGTLIKFCPTVTSDSRLPRVDSMLSSCVSHLKPNLSSLI